MALKGLISLLLFLGMYDESAHAAADSSYFQSLSVLPHRHVLQHPKLVLTFRLLHMFLKLRETCRTFRGSSKVMHAFKYLRQANSTTDYLPAVAIHSKEIGKTHLWTPDNFSCIVTRFMLSLYPRLRPKIILLPNRVHRTIQRPKVPPFRQHDPQNIPLVGW